MPGTPAFQPDPLRARRQPGYLHLGHVLNAKWVWGLARAHGARVLLRIEDHDRERCRPEYERAILDDLDWLGFTPDLFPTDAFRAGPCESRQSDRHAIYEAAARELTSRGLVYGCTCSRQQFRKPTPGIGFSDPTDGETDPRGRFSELRYPAPAAIAASRRDRAWPGGCGSSRALSPSPT